MPNFKEKGDDSDMNKNNSLNYEEKNYSSPNTINPAQVQRNKFVQVQDKDNSIDIDKLNNLHSNIELLENKIRQTRNIGNSRNEHVKNKSINIIQDYNENNFSRSREYSKNSLHKENNRMDRDNENDTYFNIRSYNDSNYEDLNSRSVSRYNRPNQDQNLFYQSNGDYNFQSEKQEQISEKDVNMIRQSQNNDEIYDDHYQSKNSSFVTIDKKKNHSTSVLKNFSNMNIGYIPDELSRSPAMRKSIDRSKLLRRDYGCYERFRRSSNYDSIDNDSNQYESCDNVNNIYTVKNDYQENDAMNLSPERYIKNKTFNSLQNNSSCNNRWITQNKPNNRSPIRKELLFNNNNYKSRSPFRDNYRSDSRTFNQSSYLSKTNYNKNSNNFNDYKVNSSIENLKNLSMFSVKSDHLKIKSQNLATFLYDLVIVDSLSESNKESLSLRTDLSLKDLFDLFDISKRKSISLVDFQDTLKKIDIYVPLPELKLTFKRFDTDMDGRLE